MPGVVLAWGDNSVGSLGDGTLTSRLTPTPQTAPTPQFPPIEFVQICVAALFFNGYGLTSTGEVYAWGRNGEYQVGQGYANFGQTFVDPILVPGLPVISKIVGATGGCFALSTDGNLYAWGANDFSGLVTNAGGFVTTATLTLSGVAGIWSAHHETLAVMTDGSVRSGGFNAVGGVGDGTTTTRPAWVTIDPVPGKQVVQSAAYSLGQYVLMSDGTVYGVGSSSQGQLGFISGGSTVAWTQIPISDVVLIAAMGNTGFFVQSDGSAWAIGGNHNGALGAGLAPGSPVNTTTPVPMVFPVGVRPVQFGDTSHPSAPSMICLGSDNLAYVWGHGAYGQMGDGLTTTDNPTPTPVPSLSYVYWVGGSGVSMFARAVTLAVVMAWGADGETAGALGLGTTSIQQTSPVPQVAEFGFVQIVTAGESASFGLTADGVVYHWGANNGWEMGTGSADFDAHPTPTPVVGLPPIIHIVGTRRGCFALTATGDLYCWGGNSSGAFGIGAAIAHTPTLSTSNVATITASLYNTTIVLTGGVVQSCGDNTLGGVGDGTTTDRNTWTTIDPVPGKQVVASACYVQGQYVLMSDGTVYGVGRSTHGQLGFVSPGDTTTWTQIPVSAVEAIYATGGSGGGTGFFVLTDGTTWAIGSNYRGLLGAGLDPVSTPLVSTPVQVGFPLGVRPLQFGGPGSATTAPIAKGSDGRVYTWGDGEFGTMGNGTVVLSNPFPLANPDLTLVEFVGGGRTSQFAKATFQDGPGGPIFDGANYAWGTNTEAGLAGTGYTVDHLSPTPMAMSGLVTQIVTTFQGNALDAAAFALGEDSLVYAWGSNSLGQLGNGTTDGLSHPIPTVVAGIEGIVRMVAGHNDVYAFTETGDLWAWGFNQVGQLGLGHVSPVLTPELIATGVADVSEGGTQSIILFLDGTVQTAGGNSFGQLGIGTADGANHPNRHTVFPGAGVIAVRATVATTYLLYADGTVKGWGFSNTGQLGIISSINTALMTVPIANVVEVGRGGQQAFFLLSDGTAWAIGSNTDGVLGVGQSFSALNLTTTPLQMLWPVGIGPVRFGSSINNNTTIAMMAAIASDGRVYTWGTGDAGQLGSGGLGVETNHTPISLNGLSGMGTIGGGYTTIWASEGEAGGGTTPLSGHARSYAQIIG